MRIASFIFLGLVLVLLANLAVSAAYPPYREAVRNFRMTLVPSYVHQESQAPVVNPSESNANSDAALAESLSRVNSGLEALLASSGTGTQGTGAVSQTGTVSVPSKTGAILTGATTQNTGTGTEKIEKKDDAVLLSGLLLARLMPDFMPKKVENKGIYDIHIFSGIPYSTYADDKTKLRLYAFGETYSVMLSNLKLVSNVYTVNETDTFFDSTFFLNSTSKKDTTIRFVTQLEGKAIGFEVPKSMYPKLKKLLLTK